MTWRRHSCLPRRDSSRRFALALLLLAAPAPARDFATFARDLIDLDALPRLDSAPIRMESSWDRTGGNSDSINPAWLKDGVYTIADLKGPGVVRRFYSARPGGHLRIFVDGGAKPVIDMPSEDFFAGGREPFTRPMTGPMGGGNYSFFPIPYAKSIRLETTPLGGPANAHGVYYQVTYQTFPEGTPIRSLSLPLAGADLEAWRRVADAWRNAGRDPRPVSAGRAELAKRASLAPGETAILAELTGAGAIEQLHLKLDSPDDAALRSTLLKIRWDDQETDAVDAPVGDFFGNGFSRVPYKSLPMGLTADGYYSYFAMPFAGRAQVRLVNESADQSITVALKLAWRKTDSMPAGAGYFHAKWRREEVAGVNLYRRNLTGEYNYRILDVRGRGRYIGSNLNVFNRHLFWWGEGDPMIFLDGDTWPPSFHGTGTEEYFNDAWGFHEQIEAVGADPNRREQNVVPVSGALLAGLAYPANCYAGNAVFTFHLADSIPFRERIRVTVEHGTENDLTNDYSSTAYWYARPPAEDFFGPRPARERAVIPRSQWEPMREQAAREFLPELRRQLAETVAEIPRKPTDAFLYRPRIMLIRRILRLAPPSSLRDPDRARLQSRLQSTIGGPDKIRWNVMDETLLALARFLK